jgi:hypothetical protein
MQASVTEGGRQLDDATRARVVLEARVMFALNNAVISGFDVGGLRGVVAAAAAAVAAMPAWLLLATASAGAASLYGVLRMARAW